jgi:TPR repeat protein
MAGTNQFEEAVTLYRIAEGDDEDVGDEYDDYSADGAGRKAFKIFEKLAGEGNVEAMLYLGRCCEFHIGIDVRDYPNLGYLDKAAEWYRKAIDHDNLDALVALGTMYLEYEGWTNDKETGFALLQKATDKGSKKAKMIIIMSGGVPK